MDGSRAVISAAGRLRVACALVAAGIGDWSPPLGAQELHEPIAGENVGG